MKKLKVGDKLECTNTYLVKNYEGITISDFVIGRRYIVIEINDNNVHMLSICGKYKTIFSFTELSKYFNTSGYLLEQTTEPSENAITTEHEDNGKTPPTDPTPNTKLIDGYKEVIRLCLSFEIEIPEKWIKEYNRLIEREM